MSPTIMIAADILVVVLLVATIATSVRLSGRIAQLKADESALRSTIAELVGATGMAERAIGGLRATVAECDRSLAERLRAAEAHSAELSRILGEGESVLTRIEHFVHVTRRAVHTSVPPTVAPAPPVAAAPRTGEALRSAVATARAVAERAARRVESRAA